ncbi:hypothetical protein Tco_1196512, partial [Tanacetum coccineum]
GQAYEANSAAKDTWKTADTVPAGSGVPAIVIMLVPMVIGNPQLVDANFWVLWIQNQLLDYGFNFMNTKIFIDNQSTICIVKNLVFHQRTKHIEIRHHFIRDANEKNLIQVLKIHTDDNVADLLTKAFDGPRFNYLVVHIGMLNP